MIKHTFFFFFLKEHRIQLLTQVIKFLLAHIYLSGRFVLTFFFFFFRQSSNVSSKIWLFTSFLLSEYSSLILQRNSLITSGLQRKNEA